MIDVRVLPQQKNIKQKFISLIKKFKVSEEVSCCFHCCFCCCCWLLLLVCCCFFVGFLFFVLAFVCFLFLYHILPQKCIHKNVHTITHTHPHTSHNPLSPPLTTTFSLKHTHPHKAFYTRSFQHKPTHTQKPHTRTTTGTATGDRVARGQSDVHGRHVRH